MLGRWTLRLLCLWGRSVFSARWWFACLTIVASAQTKPNPALCSSTLARAFDTPGPVVIDAIVDPYEPPMPATVTARQAAHFAEALAKGTREREKLLKDSFKYKIRELV
jgi:pyruvate dehydrogenase (quinone)